LIDYLKQKINKFDFTNLQKFFGISNYIENFHQYFEPYTLSLDEFFKEKSLNLKLFQKIQSIEKNNIENSNYYKNSVLYLDTILKRFNESDIIYSEICKLSKLPEDELKFRLKLLPNLEENKEKFFSMIKQNFLSFGNLLEKIDLCEEYYKKINITEKEKKQY
jgi:hypothetical protein